MNKTLFYSIISSMKSSEEIVPNNIKIQALNNIKNKIDELERRTMDLILLNALTTISNLVEDAYRISLYRFQFQLLTNIINKELKTIEETIAYAAEAI